jgi:hypothetical protein
MIVAKSSELMGLYIEIWANYISCGIFNDLIFMFIVVRWCDPLGFFTFCNTYMYVNELTKYNVFSKIKFWQNKHF